MFSPEFLQRLVSALNYDIDYLILPLAYISFSDRMGLANQAVTAQSFFKPDIYPHLPWKFWLRNYDINLYASRAVAQLCNLYQYRNDTRNLWENPFTEQLKKIPGVRKNIFLEVDAYQSWRFPDGFDRNLFDWSLYAMGRKNHLADLQSLIQLAGQNNIDILASNLPVDFAKDPHKVNKNDFRLYQSEIRSLLETVTEYTDYQDNFPVAFTSYDALHPTWHGARLHALFFALQLNAKRTNPLPEGSICSAFTASESPVSSSYKKALNELFSSQTAFSMRRYDIFEPENAGDLLSRLALTTPGSKQEDLILYQLSLRLRYWEENKFIYNDTKEMITAVVTEEINKARQRVIYFKQKLIELQKIRLAEFPLSEMPETSRVDSKILLTTKQYTIRESIFSDSQQLVKKYTDVNSGKTIAFHIQNRKDNIAYSRIDILGDGSFIQLSFKQNLTVPHWLRFDTPYKMFGI